MGWEIFILVLIIVGILVTIAAERLILGSEDESIFKKK